MSKLNISRHYILTKKYFTIDTDDLPVTVTDENIVNNITVALNYNMLDQMFRLVFEKIKESKFKKLDRSESLKKIRKIVSDYVKDEENWKNFRVVHDIYKANGVKKVRDGIVSDIRKYLLDDSCRKEEIKEYTTRVENYILTVIDNKKAINSFFEGSEFVLKDGVLYYNDKPLKENKLVRHVIESLRTGVPSNNYINFLKKVTQNPRDDIREELFDFLENGKFPIHEDGDFSAYKYVKEDWKDAYTGTVDHTIGSKPRLDWSEVDTNRHNTCSKGLHFCAYEYLSQYNASRRIVEVKINPADVAAIPTDYNNTKGRCVGYEVIKELERKEDIFKGSGKLTVKEEFDEVEEDLSDDDYDCDDDCDDE